MKYFKLTKVSKINNLGIKLFQIELTVDCKWGKKGEKGGWVENKNQITGNAWVSGDAWVYGNARISGDAVVSGNAQVSGDAVVYGNARISGDAVVSGGAWEKSPLQIQGTRHFVNMDAKKLLKIGCKVFELSYWEKNFKEIGKDAGYTDAEIKEYELYIKLAISLSK